MTNLARSYQRSNKRDDKKGHLDNWRLEQKWQIWQQYRDMLTVGDFNKNDKVDENCEFGKK